MIVLHDLQKAHIPHFVIELLYPNQTSVVPEATTVRAESVLFHKENLWNLVERQVPDRYTKLLFLDGDIRFTQPNWYDATSNVLATHTVIQPMAMAAWGNRYRSSVAGAITNGEQHLRLALHHPGFAVGIDRHLFRNLNGFYDKAVIGSGDTIFWNHILGAVGLPQFPPEQLAKHFSAYHGLEERQNQVRRFASEISIGCLTDNTAVHLPHGNLRNRRYSSRANGLEITRTQLWYNNDGVLETHNAKLNKYMKAYFESRKEDS